MILDLDDPSRNQTLAFSNEAEFNQWMYRQSIASIVQDKTGTGLVSYKGIQDGATYTVRSTGMRATLERLDGAARHLANSREDEATKAIVLHYQDKGASRIETHPELRVVRDKSGNHIAEVDGVLSHKYAADASDVWQLQDTISTKLQQVPELAGRPIVPAFMAESIKQGSEQKVRDACRRAGMLYLYRNGSAVSVECRAGQGTGGRRVPSRLQLHTPVSWRQRCVASASNSMQRKVVMF